MWCIFYSEELLPAMTWKASTPAKGKDRSKEATPQNTKAFARGSWETEQNFKWVHAAGGIKGIEGLSTPHWDPYQTPLVLCPPPSDFHIGVSEG